MLYDDGARRHERKNIACSTWQHRNFKARPHLWSWLRDQGNSAVDKSSMTSQHNAPLYLIMKKTSRRQRTLSQVSRLLDGSCTYICLFDRLFWRYDIEEILFLGWRWYKIRNKMQLVGFDWLSDWYSIHSVLSQSRGEKACGLIPPTCCHFLSISS